MVIIIIIKQMSLQAKRSIFQDFQYLEKVQLFSSFIGLLCKDSLHLISWVFCLTKTAILLEDREKRIVLLWMNKRHRIFNSKDYSTDGWTLRPARQGKVKQHHTFFLFHRKRNDLSKKKFVLERILIAEPGFARRVFNFHPLEPFRFIPSTIACIHTTPIFTLTLTHIHTQPEPSPTHTPQECTWRVKLEKKRFQRNLKSVQEGPAMPMPVEFYFSKVSSIKKRFS